MTDIIRLGMQVDTSQLSDATVKLKSVAQAAAGVASAAQKMSAAASGAGSSLTTASVAASRMALQDAKLNTAKMRTIEGVTRAQIKEARSLENTARLNLEVAKTEALRSKSVEETINALKRKVSAETAAAKVVATPIAAAANTNFIPHDMRPNRFNTANLAAQFQDIGVTASMGMNPLTIAIQQGTQLSAIMNSMEKPLQGLGQAFASVINPVSLLSIGLVAVVAAGIQMVDWVSVGQGALLGMASALDGAAEGIASFATQTPVMLTGLYLLIPATWSLVTGLYAVTAAAVSAAGGVIAAFIAMNAPILAVMVTITGFTLAMQAIFGENFITGVKTGINYMIGAVTGAYRAIQELWGSIPAVFASGMIEAGNRMHVAFKKTLNALLESINEWLSYVPEILGGSKNTITFRFDEKAVFQNPYAEEAAKAGNIAGNIFAEEFKKDHIGIIAQTVKDGITYTTGQMRSLSEYLGTLDPEKEKKKKGATGKTDLEKYQDIENSALRRIASLKAEQQALFLTAEEAAKLTFYTEMLNDAQQKGIILTTEQKSRLGALAEEMAAIQEHTKKTEEAMDFLKTSTKGFFDDMRSGLEQGKGLWDSFLDAVTNVLNKITDKIIESQMDQMFSSFGQTGSGQGFLGDIVSLFSAKGNVFSAGNVTPFAKGGAFTNSIITSPTLFGFAKGDAFGVMGEAGAEAVMPLHRGSDGSLGVKMSGGVGGTNVVVNVNNNSKASASVQQRETSNGIEIDVTIDEIVGSKLNERGSNSNRSTRSINSQALIRR